MPQPLAKWDPTRDVWETEQMDLFSGRSDVYSEIWPRSGSMRNGVAYELPTWAHRMEGPGSSSSRNGALLPSPRTSDTNGPGKHGDGGLDLRTAVSLLPTPTTTDVAGARNETANRKPGAVFAKGRTLSDVLFLNAWGDYAPAIKRWEFILGRPAPAPSVPDGKNGRHRLSARFAEWMMGLPEGWVTDVNITRNEQIKALGNGVVPQQCSAALKDMLASHNVTTLSHVA